MIWPQSFDYVHEELWQRRNRRFLVMINANKLPALRWHELYTERLRALDYFGQFGEIDLYGKGWNEGVPYRLSYEILPGTAQSLLRTAEKLWRRVAPDPLMTAAQRAWKESRKANPKRSRTIASRYVSRMRSFGWMTEKIFDCFFAGVVPVYLGATDIAEHVPADIFIDMRDFAGYHELHNFLRNLSDADVEGYRERARTFLESAAFAPFRKRSFVGIFRKIVEEDAGVKLPD